MEHRGAMLDIKRKQMNSIINNAISEPNVVHIGYFDSNGFQDDGIISADDFEIYIQDILYYSSDTKKTVKRSDDRCDITKVKNTLLYESKISSIQMKKAYPWSYENECRLVVSVKKSAIFDRKNCHIIRLPIPVNTLQELRDQVYKSPNFDTKTNTSNISANDSSLGQSLDWNLCAKCKSKNNNSV